MIGEIADYHAQALSRKPDADLKRLPIGQG